MSDPCASRHALALAYHVHDLAVACPNGHAEAGEPCPDDRDTEPGSAPWFLLCDGGVEVVGKTPPEVILDKDERTMLAEWERVLGR